MKTSFVGLIAYLLVFTALSGCNRENAVEPVNVSELNGTWRLVQPASQYNPTLVLERQNLPTITTIQAFKVSGRLAVNTHSAQLLIPRVTSHDVSVEEITSTYVGGSAEAMQFEKTYLANLRAVTRFELTNQNRLWLYYNGTPSGKLVYEKL